VEINKGMTEVKFYDDTRQLCHIWIYICVIEQHLRLTVMINLENVIK